jgi:hypothetical protein
MSEEVLETDALLAEYGRVRRELTRQQAECDALRGELGQAEQAAVAEREKRRKVEAFARGVVDIARDHEGRGAKLPFDLHAAIVGLCAVLKGDTP